jgi:hypothetical protein
LISATLLSSPGLTYQSQVLGKIRYKKLGSIYPKGHFDTLIRSAREGTQKHQEVKRVLHDIVKEKTECIFIDTAS